MAIYTIKINESTITGKSLIAFLRSLKDVVFISRDERENALDEALRDVEHGRVFEPKDGDDLIRKCLS